MTPNQAEELHDIIRTAELPDEEQRRLHDVVARDVDTPARKGISYVKITSDGTPYNTRVLAVDVHGRTVPLDCSFIRFEMHPHGGTVVLGLPLPGVEVDLDLETHETVIRKLAQEIDLKDATDLDSDTVPGVKVEPPRGPHVHVYIDGLCKGCGKRE